MDYLGIVFFVAVFIVAFFGLLVVVGNLMAESVTMVVGDFIPCGAGKVWETMHDVGKYPHGGSQVRNVTVLEQSPALIWEEDMGSTKVQVRTVHDKAPSFCVREMTDAVVPMVAVGDCAGECDGGYACDRAGQLPY